jgi:hypothetical protein
MIFSKKIIFRFFSPAHKGSWPSASYKGRESACQNEKENRLSQNQEARLTGSKPK